MHVITNNIFISINMNISLLKRTILIVINNIENNNQSNNVKEIINNYYNIIKSKLNVYRYLISLFN